MEHNYCLPVHHPEFYVLDNDFNILDSRFSEALGFFNVISYVQFSYDYITRYLEMYAEDLEIFNEHDYKYVLGKSRIYYDKQRIGYVIENISEDARREINILEGDCEGNLGLLLEIVSEKEN